MMRWSCLLALVGLGVLGAQARADGGPATPGGSLSVAAEGERCGSVVIRHCRVRPAPPSLIVDPHAPPVGTPPTQWEAVRSADPENDEIFVVGERIREADVRAVFDRNLGPAPGPTAMVTRDAGAGARCTTVARSGATLCSSNGGTLPGLSVPSNRADWTF